MQALGYESAVLSSGGDAEPLYAEKGIRHVPFAIRTKNEFHPKLLWNLPRVVKLVKEEKYGVLHAHTRVTQVLAAMVSRMTGVPVVTTAHGFYKRRLGRRLFGAWGDRVVAVSPLVAEELAKTHKISKDRIRLIFNAIDIEAFRKRVLAQDSEAIRAKLSIPRDAFVIGSVSRLVKDKGHDYLLKAAAKLLKKNPNVFVIIVGDGRERKPLEKLVKKLKLSKNVLLIASDPDITGPLSVMDAFAHPATWREGFGLSMLEAMVAKVPVAVSDIWAINTIVRHRVNGFLVEPKNADKLAETLEFILKNPDVAGSIAHNGYEMASRAYSADRLAGELAAVYEETIRG
jgi:glycosyltransferase involved in cell wall biosynthesis